MAFKKNEIEFESDKVKVYVQQLQAINGILAQQLDQLKAELDQINLTNERLVREKHDLHCDVLKLKTALQEIKDYCNKYPQNSIGFKKQILQKCEVENV